jgi:hypothetical protein
LSGKLAENRSSFTVENWLYVAGVHHANDYFLSAANETVNADFFLPEFQLAIDIWGAEDDAAALSNKLNKQEFYQKYGYDFIELREESVAQLDEVLAKQLFQFGLAVY